jgi:hypothetical protein
VTSRYASLAEARADQVFERGWLPDILPLSATSIRTSNNLDLNVSEGEFVFAPADNAQWLRHLRPYQPMDELFAASREEVDRMQRKGFRANSYACEDSVWVFYCKSDVSYCRYYMWLRRSASMRQSANNPLQ